MPPITLVGHPYASIGMGEQLRGHLRACQAVCLPATVLDIFRHAPRDDAEHLALVQPAETEILGPGLRIFHVNGDEAARVLQRLADLGQDFAGGRNVVVPAWELAHYPAEWAAELRRFDEVWALSGFIRDALASAGIGSRLIGQPVEPTPGLMLPRRHFGLRESAFIVLGMLDLTSFVERKNPAALPALAAKIRDIAPLLDVQFVLKAKSGENNAAEWAAAWREVHPDLVILDRKLDALATRSLLATCDCLVSLHRAEGFGRTVGEAMALGRLVLATGFSGSLDIAHEGTALIARHTLVAVPPGAYPHGEGQLWAEPDLDHAASLLLAAIRTPAAARRIAAAGQRAMRLSFSNRAVGLRILQAAETLTQRPGMVL